MDEEECGEPYCEETPLTAGLCRDHAAAEGLLTKAGNPRKRAPGAGGSKPKPLTAAKRAGLIKTKVKCGAPVYPRRADDPSKPDKTMPSKPCARWARVGGDRCPKHPHNDKDAENAEIEVAVAKAAVEFPDLFVPLEGLTRVQRLDGMADALHRLMNWYAEKVKEDPLLRHEWREQMAQAAKMLQTLESLGIADRAVTVLENQPAWLEFRAVLFRVLDRYPDAKQALIEAMTPLAIEAPADAEAEEAEEDAGILDGELVEV